jgi:hypothetical protein
VLVAAEAVEKKRFGVVVVVAAAVVTAAAEVVAAVVAAVAEEVPVEVVLGESRSAQSRRTLSALPRHRAWPRSPTD